MPARAVVVGLLWIATSALYSTYGNALFLKSYGDPYSHTFLRFALSSGLGLSWAISTNSKLLWRFRDVARGMLLPSTLLLTANLMNSMGMLRSGLTVTYVVKSLIPFFTVMVCRFRGQRFSYAVYLSLVPVCAGVSLASATDLDFDMSGFVCALVSTLSQTLLNVTSRQRIEDLRLSGAEAFLVMATTCTALSLPLLAVSYYTVPTGLIRVLIDGGGSADLSRPTTAGAIVVLASFAYFVEYMLNFAYVPLCSSLAFSVTDITRRLGSILAGAALFSKPLGPLNILGVLISLLGVISYTLVAKVGGERVVLPRPAALTRSQSSSKGMTPDRPVRKSQAGVEDLGAWAAHYSALIARSKMEAKRPMDSREVEEGYTPTASPRSSCTDYDLESDDPDSTIAARTRRASLLLQAADDSSLGIAPAALFGTAAFFAKPLAQQRSASMPDMQHMVAMASTSRRAPKPLPSPV
mmetsp:Transcript_127820/g.368038  ORF Transcript_127820/g.368038 Transcript_127820/m.368038 type:complete len:467 (+) Transcript_127820:54-1454(+)